MSNIFSSQPWISDHGNSTEVLEDTNEKMNSGDYKYCPKETPFVVDGTCVKCDYGQIYNVNIKKCVVPAENLVYNPNTHNLLTPEEGK